MSYAAIAVHFLSDRMVGLNRAWGLEGVGG